MPPIGNTASLPFKVERTSTGQLPVFSDIRNGRTNVLTIVRRCAGDLAELKGELEKLTGSLVEIKTNKLEIKGPHTKKVKLWLRHLGY
jgi:large subunit ribosomal protein L49